MSSRPRRLNSLARRQRMCPNTNPGSPAMQSPASSAGVNWNQVPEFARHHVTWIDGRHGSAQAALPPIDAEPVPKILYRLPALHPDRPTGSKAMLDAHGARVLPGSTAATVRRLVPLAGKLLE